jgi:hypothetical protein
MGAKPTWDPMCIQAQVLSTLTENCFAFLEFFKGKTFVGVSNRYLIYTRCSAVADDGSIIACARSIDPEQLPSSCNLKTFVSPPAAPPPALSPHTSSPLRSISDMTNTAVRATLMLGGMVFRPLPPAVDGRCKPCPRVAVHHPLPPSSAPPLQPPNHGQLCCQR